MRIAFGIIFALHGLIHLLGVVRYWRLAEVPGFASPLPADGSEAGLRVQGLLWLLASLTLLAAAFMLWLRSGPYWVVGGIGVVLSQALIFSAFRDAYAGTWLNVVLLVPIVLGAADARFQAQSRVLVEALMGRAAESPRASRVQQSDLSGLPPPVQRWLQGAGVVGQSRPRTVRLRQEGFMRPAPGKGELDAHAVQYFRVDEPEFLWRVRAFGPAGLPIAGRDSYEAGRGRMVIALLSMVRVADAHNSKIDQGALLRYLAETVWFPSAALSSFIRFQPVDDRRAQAIMTWGGVEASAEFHFDAQDRVAAITARRYFGGEPDAKLEDWEITMTAWEQRGGCLVPVRGEVAWNLPAGRYTFYRWSLPALDVDPAEPYPEDFGPFPP